MGEPFSAAGSAVGIISLGLTVCDNIISYYQAYKGQDDEIFRITRRAKELHDTLALLQRQLQDHISLNPVIIDQIQVCLLSCKNSIADIDAIVKRFSKPQDDSKFISKVRRRKQKSLFPFKRDTLRDLNISLSLFQTNLSTAVQLLHIEMLSRQFGAISMLHALSTHTADEVRGFSNQVEALNSSLAQFIAKPDSPDTSDFQDQVNGRADGKSCSSSSTTPFRTFQPPMDESFSSCTCTSPTKSFVFRRFRPTLSLLYVDKNGYIHNDGCTMWKTKLRERTAVLTVSLFGRIYSGSFTLMNSPFLGMQNFSISPNLTVKATVGNDAPAFRLINEVLGSFKKVSTIADGNVFDAYFLRLQEIFRERRASPTDVNERGLTILHQMCLSVGSIYQCGQTAFQYYRQFILGLISIGVPVNEMARWGNTPLDTLLMCGYLQTLPSLFVKVDHSDVQSLALRLLDNHAEPSAYGCLKTGQPHCAPFEWGPRMVSCLARFGGWAEDFECGKLSAAILQRSETRVKECLRISRSCISERNILGQTPLHLSSTWPAGISLLLQAGAGFSLNQPDIRGFVPLAYAVIAGYDDATRLMLNAGGILPVGKTTEFDGPYVDVLEIATTRSTDEILHELVSTLYKQRMALQEYVSMTLPLHLRPDHVPDEEAIMLLEQLEKHKIQVPFGLRQVQKRGTLYHATYLDIRLARHLFHAGFRDIEGTHEQWTPLMLCGGATLNDLLKLASWLISNGGDLSLSTPMCSCIEGNCTCYLSPTSPLSKTAHRLASEVGWTIFRAGSAFCNGERPTCKLSATWFMELLSNLDVLSQQLLRDLFTDGSRDSCICACTSSHGCSPAIMMLKSMEKPPQNLEYSYRNFRMTKARPWIIEWMLGSQRLEPTGSAFDWLVTDVIRFMTFEELGLTHICCYDSGHGRRRHFIVKEDSEIDEICEKEVSLLDELDTLVVEFRGKYTELRVPFHEFLSGYWDARMKEVAKKGSLNE